MKRIVSLFAMLLAFSFCMSAQYYSNLDRYKTANEDVISSGIRPKAVFIGDSIFDGWYANVPSFFDDNNYLGRGIGGQVSSEILLRFRKDVVELAPKYVVILCGVNDIAMNRGPIDMAYTMANIASMVEMAKAAKIKPVVCLLFPGPKIGWREIPDAFENAETLNSMITEYAAKNHVKCMKFFRDVETVDGSLPKELSLDSIHPNVKGYGIMAEEIKRVLK